MHWQFKSEKVYLPSVVYLGTVALMRSVDAVEPGWR